MIVLFYRSEEGEMKWLNYHHLMHFRTIALEGGISKAAKKLRLGQSGLSTQLKQFEESLGHSLFERKNRNLTLSDAGRITLKYANEINQKGQELLEVLGDETLSSRSHLNLGALDSIPKHLIAKLVDDARKITKCQITVLEGRGDELLREVSSNQLDIMISNYPSPAMGAGIYSRSLAKVPVAIFGAPKYKKLRKNFPHSLASQPIVLPTYHSRVRQDVDHFFHSNSIIYDIIAEIQDTSVQKLLAIDGKGVVPLPEFSVKDLTREKKLIKIGVLEDVYEEFWMISAKRTIKNPVTTELMKNFKFSF
jgi:LysR family transcriptional regulator, transcriptional activator of nhaA